MAVKRTNPDPMKGEHDEKIMAAINALAFKRGNPTNIAAKAGLPVQAVRYRLIQLREHKVLASYQQGRTEIYGIEDSK